ncbi:MAG TPA: hypothetical protein VK845_08850 [Gemmatimonadales bacterium]|nr:hypothetical protein [Gemmatimonadales bacterium]
MGAPTWEEVGRPRPRSLTEARLQLHWAAQVPAAVGHTFGTPQPDDSQSSFRWDAVGRVLAGQPVGAPGPIRAALRPADLTLLLMTEAGEALAECALDGRTLDQAYAWMEQAVASFAGELAARTLERRDYDMPTHAVSSGEPFRANPVPALMELERWFGNAHGMLMRLQADEPTGSPVRCWPHHFDLGMLIQLDPGADPEHARSIGIGLSPGDGSYDEPYWYVNPWPRPTNDADRPTLPHGHWHTEGWLGAVLPGTELVSLTAEGQATAVHDFLRAAVRAARTILGAGAA